MKEKVLRALSDLLTKFAISFSEKSVFIRNGII